MDEFHKGLEVEQKEHPELNPIATARLVLDHMEENEYYYSKKSEDMTMATAGDASATKMADQEKEEKITSARPQAPLAEKEALQLLSELDELSELI